jgi:hypothetical protein
VDVLKASITSLFPSVRWDIPLSKRRKAVCPPRVVVQRPVTGPGSLYGNRGQHEYATETSGRCHVIMLQRFSDVVQLIGRLQLTDRATTHR